MKETIAWRLWEASLAREGPPPTKNHVFLVFTARTGSKIVLSYLNAIPGVTMLFELLNPNWLRVRYPIMSRLAGSRRLRFTSPERAVRFLSNRLESLPTPIVGAKFQDSHLARSGLRVEHLRQGFPGARFVLLYRESLAEQFVSLKVARQTGVWVAHKGKAAEPFAGKIEIDPVEFQDFCRRMRGFYDAARREVPGALAISYEQVCSDASGVQRRLATLLGKTPVAAEARTEKQNSRPLHDVVENYDRLKERLSSERLLLG